MTDRVIRVLLADDQAMVRKGVRALLQTEPGIEVVGEAENGEAAVELAQRLRPDVILMDIAMPKLDGVEATRRIMARQPEARIVVVTSFAADDKVFPAMKAGALGYLLKDAEPEELTRAIRLAAQGEAALDPTIARKMMRELVRPPTRQTGGVGLSERELETLKLVAQGLSNSEIAAQLAISEATVRTHVSSILAKLQLASRTQAALYALRTGIAKLDEA